MCDLFGTLAHVSTRQRGLLISVSFNYLYRMAPGRASCFLLFNAQVAETVSSSLPDALKSHRFTPINLKRVNERVNDMVNDMHPLVHVGQTVLPSASFLQILLDLRRRCVVDVWPSGCWAIRRGYCRRLVPPQTIITLMSASLVIAAYSH